MSYDIYIYNMSHRKSLKFISLKGFKREAKVNTFQHSENKET